MYLDVLKLRILNKARMLFFWNRKEADFLARVEKSIYEDVSL